MIRRIKNYLRQNDSCLSEFLMNRYYERREKCNIGLTSRNYEKQDGEDLYIKKWKHIQRFPSPYAYRLYSQYIGSSENIVSQIAANKINSVLNPTRYDGYLQDKNNFDRILPKASFPKTILRKIQGQFYDEAYNAVKRSLLPQKINMESVESGNKIIIKDTLDSNSGRGIALFYVDKNALVPINQSFKPVEKIDLMHYLENRKEDFIVQEALTQSEFMSQFNRSSINTIRIAVYRSVKDVKPHILSAVVRMGVAGKFIDNLHGGGRMVRIKDKGILDDHCVDQYGRIFTQHNGIDFSQELILPNFDVIENMVLDLSADLYDIHLIQWDISIDDKNSPRLIEFNLNGFSMWIAQMTGTPAFGQFTDEIIEYVESVTRG